MASSGSGVGTPISGGGVTTGKGLGPLHPPPRTLLPISRYAAIMGINISHFWQMAGPLNPLRSGCDKVWDQDARELLAWTMAQAEEMIAEELGFFVAPNFITNERQQMATLGVRSDWRNAELKTDWSYIECLGTEQLTLVKADAVVRYEDLDNDPKGFEETASIGNELYADLTACSEECEVAVFIREEDGAEDSADERWEIRPIKVDIDGTTMNIKAQSPLFVKPELLSLTERDSHGETDWIHDFTTVNLVSRVDVYCRTVNKATPVTLLWDGACDCVGVCDHQTQAACGLMPDPNRGYFIPRPATWNGSANVETIPTKAFAPESVKVNYRAGYPIDSKCRINHQLERAIVKLTNVLLPEPPCGFCDSAATIWKKDRLDIDPLTPEAVSMPWDMYSRGALEAWRIIKRFRRGRGGKLGR